MGSELLPDSRQIQRQIVDIRNDNYRQTLRFEEGAAPHIVIALQGVETALDLDCNCQRR
jgi:hypothetical protein